MHIQVVNFNLKDMSEQEYHQLCDEVAPVFASMPGLISKVWLADPAANTYGGVYTWRDRQGMETYLNSDFFKAVAANPHLANIGSKDFAVMEAPSRVTHGLVAVAV